MGHSQHVVLALRRLEERQAISSVLIELPVIVHHVHTGQEAIHIIEDYGCDLLMMDLQLADMHAWTMLGKLKEIVDLEHMAITVFLDIQDVVPIEGVVPIVRPVAISRIRQIVRSALSNSATSTGGG